MKGEDFINNLTDSSLFLISLQSLTLIHTFCEFYFSKAIIINHIINVLIAIIFWEIIEQVLRQLRSGFKWDLEIREVKFRCILIRFIFLFKGKRYSITCIIFWASPEQVHAWNGLWHIKNVNILGHLFIPLRFFFKQWWFMSVFHRRRCNIKSNTIFILKPISNFRFIFFDFAQSCALSDKSRLSFDSSFL